MAATGMPEDIAKLSFEAALAELEEIVRSLESGQGALDQAIQSYERGAWLKRHCEAKLVEARAKVERISTAPDGSPVAEALDPVS